MKRFFLLTLAVVMLATMAIPTAFAKPAIRSYVQGDIDGNGTVTITDSTLAMRAALGFIDLTDAQIARGDMNGDGDVTTVDAAIILRIAMELTEPDEPTVPWQTWAQASTVDGNWGEIVLGYENGNTYTLANYGCGIVAWGKLVIQKGLISPANFTPFEMVDTLRSVGAITSTGKISFPTAANAFDGFAYVGRPQFDGTTNLTTESGLTAITNAVLDELRQGHSVLLHVRKSDRPTPHHWVAVDTDRTLATGVIHIFDSLRTSSNGVYIPHPHNHCNTSCSEWRYVQCSEMIVYD